MSKPSLLALQQAVEPEPPLLRAVLNLDYANKPGALRHVSLEIAAGEIVGLVGESGSGKSSVALSLMRLLRWNAAKLNGSIRFGGRELLAASENEMRHVRGRDIALVLQSPLASLNPALRIGSQLAEAWRAHRRSSREETRERLARTLRMVSLPATEEFLDRYPRQLSVGLAQRVLIGMAILHEPKLLIADEPTSALDVITAAEILNLFARLNRELGMAILFISHDLLSVASLCRRVAIMKAGEIVECAATEQIFGSPAHDYTRALVSALPRVREYANTPLESCL
jgi:ABC-type dipeptide/oligopeptide/nickel transport system ATPase component